MGLFNLFNSSNSKSRRYNIYNEWKSFKVQTNKDMIAWKKLSFSHMQLQKAVMKQCNNYSRLSKIYLLSKTDENWKACEKVSDKKNRLSIECKRLWDKWDEEYKQITFKYSLMSVACAMS